MIWTFNLYPFCSFVCWYWLYWNCYVINCCWNVRNRCFGAVKKKKVLENTMKFTRAASWMNSKISNRNKHTTLIIFLFCRYCWPLLWYKYWTSSKLWNPTSWSRLKLTVQTQLALHPCDPFLINNRNMTGNSVEKCFAVSNVI